MSNVLINPQSWNEVVVEGATFRIDTLGRVKVIPRSIPQAVHDAHCRALMEAYWTGGEFWLKAKALLAA